MVDIGKDSNFSPREQQILLLITQGLTNRQIGEELNLSVHTVRNQGISILRKLNLKPQIEVAPGTPEARAQHIAVTEDSLTIDLVDGRSVSVPIAWYPRLLCGTHDERNNWRIIGGGEGIHWPDLDEDISIENLLAGKPSYESQRSLKRWLEQHRTGDKHPGSQSSANS